MNMYYSSSRSVAA